MMMISPTSGRDGEHSPLLVATARATSMYEPASTGDVYTDTTTRSAVPVLAHKYAVESKHIVSYQKSDALHTRRAISTYGTLTLNQVEEINDLKQRGVSPQGSPGHPHGSNNQSETESDSDGSCGSSMTQPPAVIQSILRIRTGEFAVRTLEKKPSSVGFAIDIDETDDEDDEYEGDDKTLREKRISKRRQSCSARCIPRRLTLEEKAALYQVRPDLELTPMPVLLRDLEETRRRRQRKLVFTMLGGTLILLMMVVMYYVFSQV